MGERTTASGPDGWYRFAALPPGTYVLAFDAPGMRPAERRVRSDSVPGTRLNRDVALNVLPDLFASHPDRLVRFDREAQAPPRR